MTTLKKIPAAPTAEWLARHHMKIVGCRVPKHKETIVPIYGDPAKFDDDGAPLTVSRAADYKAELYYRWILAPEDTVAAEPKKAAPKADLPPEPNWAQLAADYGVRKAEGPNPRAPGETDCYVATGGTIEFSPKDWPSAASYGGVRWIVERAPKPSEEWLKKFGVELAKYKKPEVDELYAPLNSSGLAHTDGNPVDASMTPLSSWYSGFRWTLRKAQSDVDRALEKFPVQFRTAAETLVKAVREDTPLSDMRHQLYSRHDVSKIQVDAIQAALVLLGLTPFKTSRDAIAQLGCQRENVQQLLGALVAERSGG